MSSYNIFAENYDILKKMCPIMIKDIRVTVDFIYFTVTSVRYISYDFSFFLMWTCTFHIC